MDKYVARQPIKDPESGEIVGYEVLYQTDFNAMYGGTDYAAADTIASFLMQNNEKIFHDKLTFITFTPALLFRNVAQMFDKEKLVIQLEDNLIIHPMAPAIVKKYRNQGYRFAISDFQFSQKFFSMLEYVDYIKIHINVGSDGFKKISADNLISIMKGFGKKCIATGVNTQEDFEMAKELGVDYLEGNYIAESQLSRYKKLHYMDANFFQLVVEVAKDEPDIDVLEQIISRDAGLTYSLLKLVNSAYFSHRNRITSILQGLVTLGINQLKQWVYLMSFSEGDEAEEAMEDFLKLSFIRANFAAALADFTTDLPISRSEAYMMGMFSTLGYMSDMGMEELLNELPIAEEIKDALLGREGQCKDLLDLVLAYEKADWHHSKILAQKLAIPSGMMAQTYMDCVQEVTEIWDALMLDQGEEAQKPVKNAAEGEHNVS